MYEQQTHLLRDEVSRSTSVWLDQIERARLNLVRALRSGTLPGTAEAYVTDVNFCVQRIVDMLIDAETGA